MLHWVCLKLHLAVGRKLLNEIVRVLSSIILDDRVVRAMCCEEWECFAGCTHLRLKSFRCYDQVLQQMSPARGSWFAFRGGTSSRRLIKTGEENSLGASRRSPSVAMSLPVLQLSEGRLRKTRGRAPPQAT